MHHRSMRRWPRSRHSSSPAASSNAEPTCQNLGAIGPSDSDKSALVSGSPGSGGGVPELLHRILCKWAIHRLNAHQLPFLGVEVDLEGPAVRGSDQQLRPWVAAAEDDLVDAAPGHSMTRRPLRTRRPFGSART